MARRSAGKVITLTQPSYAEPRSAVTAADFGDGVISALNQVRAKGGLPAVRLSAPQSALATQLSAHYFAAEDRPDEQETIALGLLAGWQITGMIRDGSFVSTLVPHTRDPGRWLSSTLAMPIGRSTLLDENVEEIALGPVLLSSPEALGAVVTGYRVHHGNDHARGEISRVARSRDR
jgi:hypothetical protein